MSAADVIIERLMSGIFGQGLNPTGGDDGKQTAVASGSFAGEGTTEITDAEMQGSGIAPPPAAADQPLKFLGGLGGESAFPGFSKEVTEWDSTDDTASEGGSSESGPEQGAYDAETAEGGEVIDDSSVDDFANPGTYAGKSMKPGGGGRFAKLKAKLAANGARNPAAVAAAIGRRKYGSAQMAKWSAAGRQRGG